MFQLNSELIQRRLGFGRIITEEVQVSQVRARLRALRRIITESVEFAESLGLRFLFGITDELRHTETIGLGFKFGISETINVEQIRTRLRLIIRTI